MRALFLDTASSRIVTAIAEDEKILFSFVEENDKHLSERILPMIENLFDQVKMKPKDIDVIYVVVGPGSFTGIRVGVTIAKVWAWSFGIKVVPISELELMATTPFVGDYIIPVIDARRGYVYGAIYDHTLKAKVNDSHLLLSTLEDRIPKGKKVVYVSFDELPIADLKKPELDIAKMISRHQDDPGVNPHDLNPNYLKMTEAEENLQRAHFDV